MENYGICTLSIVPVRAEPSDRAELTTQLIFGDLYKTIELSENKKWIKIRIEADNYEGWIDFKQQTPISDEEYEKLKKLSRLRSLKPVTTVSKDNDNLLVIAGSTFYSLDGSQNRLFKGYKVEDKLKSPADPSPDEIIPLAKSYLGVPYLWGGKSHFGIDCSGFVQQVYGICGYSLPRDAWQQALEGENVHLDQVKENDLAFFKNDGGKIIHIGIMMKNNKIIHASGQVRIDFLDEIGIFKEATKEYSHKLHSIKRIIK